MAVLTAEARRQEVSPLQTLRAEILRMNPSGIVVDSQTGQKAHIDDLISSLGRHDSPAAAPLILSVQEGIYREEPQEIGKPAVTPETWENLLNDHQINGDVKLGLDILAQYGLDYPPARQALAEQTIAEKPTSEASSSYDFDTELAQLQQELPRVSETTLLSIIALRHTRQLESVDTQGYPNGPETQLHDLDPLRKPQQMVFPDLQPSATGTPEEAELPTPYPLSQAVMEHAGNRPVNDPIAMTATTIERFNELKSQLDSLTGKQREAAESQLKDYLFTLALLKGQLSDLLVEGPNDDALSAYDAIDEVRQASMPEGENPTEEIELVPYNPRIDAPDDQENGVKENALSPLATRLDEAMNQTVLLEGLSDGTRGDIFVSQGSLKLLSAVEKILTQPAVVKKSERTGLAGNYENTTLLAETMLHNIFNQVMEDNLLEHIDDTELVTAATVVLSDIATLSEEELALLPARTQREFKKYQSKGDTLTRQDMVGYALVIAADNIAITPSSLADISQAEEHVQQTTMPQQAAEMWEDLQVPKLPALVSTLPSHDTYPDLLKHYYVSKLSSPDKSADFLLVRRRTIDEQGVLGEPLSAEDIAWINHSSGMGTHEARELFRRKVNLRIQRRQSWE